MKKINTYVRKHERTRCFFSSQLYIPILDYSLEMQSLYFIINRALTTAWHLLKSPKDLVSFMNVPNYPNSNLPWVIEVSVLALQRCKYSSIYDESRETQTDYFLSDILAQLSRILYVYKVVPPIFFSFPLLLSKR